MLVLAKSVKGHEYLYDASTAHQVSKASGQKIADCLNQNRYNIDDAHVWYMHEVDSYDAAYAYANEQAFNVYKNAVRRRHINRW